MPADLLLIAALAIAQPTEQASDVVTSLTPAELPAAARAAVEAEVPGMQIAEVERKEREGRIYLDVEGARPDGEEVELDLLAEGDGWRVVEVQRDIAWADVPAAARAAAGASIDPARVIESRQPDGTIIFELFAPGRPERPSLEVSLADGRAELLQEEWPH